MTNESRNPNDERPGILKIEPKIRTARNAEPTQSFQHGGRRLEFPGSAVAQPWAERGNAFGVHAWTLASHCQFRAFGLWHSFVIRHSSLDIYNGVHRQNADMMHAPEH